jgi:hypothetical protein
VQGLFFINVIRFRSYADLNNEYRTPNVEVSLFFSMMNGLAKERWGPSGNKRASDGAMVRLYGDFNLNIEQGTGNREQGI